MDMNTHAYTHTHNTVRGFLKQQLPMWRVKLV